MLITLPILIFRLLSQILIMSTPLLLMSWDPLWVIWTVSLLPSVLKSDISVIGDHLQSLTAHDSIILLRYSLAIPKLMYILRTAPCFLSSVLGEYDKCLCSIVSSITNVSMSVVDATWHQGSLPVWLVVWDLGVQLSWHHLLFWYQLLASATAATPFFQFILHCFTTLLYLVMTLLCPIGPQASLLSRLVEMMLVFREHGILHISTLL